MRVVTWNMAAGFGFDHDRHERAWRYLVDVVQPDIALLQEVVIPKWATDTWPSIAAARKYAPSPGRPDVPWGSAIVTRFEGFEVFHPSDATPWLTALTGSAVVGRVILDVPLWLASIHSNAYEIDKSRFVGIHSLPQRRCSPAGIWEIEVIAEDLERVFGQGRFIAGGDLNSALLMDVLYEDDSSALLFSNLAEMGFCDLRPRFSPNEQQTFFRKGNAPYQMDHIYADDQTASLATSWQVVCEAAHMDRDLSDHAPIVVEIDLPK